MSTVFKAGHFLLRWVPNKRMCINICMRSSQKVTKHDRGIHKWHHNWEGGAELQKDKQIPQPKIRGKKFHTKIFIKCNKIVQIKKSLCYLLLFWNFPQFSQTNSATLVHTFTHFCRSGEGDKPKIGNAWQGEGEVWKGPKLHDIIYAQPLKLGEGVWLVEKLTFFFFCGLLP